MTKPKQQIWFSAHAKERMRFRGTDESEVREAILSADWRPAELNRIECDKEFQYRAEWNGIWYAIKKVRPIFAEDKEQITVITVYVYYSGKE
jgi:hypothetical protein